MTLLSQSRIRELLDYATDYGAFDENTPNGTIPPGASSTAEPMSDLRRDSIRAYKTALAMEKIVGLAEKVIEGLVFDDSGAAGRGGNGGLISRETIKAADQLRISVQKHRGVFAA